MSGEKDSCDISKVLCFAKKCGIGDFVRTGVLSWLSDP